MGDTVTVALPGGGTGVQLQVNLSTNDDKVTPALRLLAAAVRPLAWDKQGGHPINRRLYLPEYCLSAHDPSFGRDMDLPLVMAALMNRYGEDILPEEVAYAMEDKATSSTGNAALRLLRRAAAATPAGRPGWIWPTCAPRSTMTAPSQSGWSAASGASGTPWGSGWACGASGTMMPFWRISCC